MPYVKKDRLAVLEARERQYNELITELRAMTPSKLKAWQARDSLYTNSAKWMQRISQDMWGTPATDRPVSLRELFSNANPG